MLSQERKTVVAAENFKAEVLSNECLQPSRFRLAFTTPLSFSKVVPGQFVHIKVGEGLSPLLRRPFSVSKYVPERAEIIYALVGKGTKILSSLKKGDSLDIIGPLGSGFFVSEKVKTHILVGGGRGVAPLVFLAHTISQKMKNDSSIRSFLGFKRKQEIICQEDFSGKKLTLQIATEDGSSGYKGLVSELLQDYLQETFSTSELAMYACGPKKLLEVVARLSFDYGIFSQVSMEEIIGCGVGACRGCVVEGVAGYMRVCQEGPVFDTRNILWGY